MLLLFHLLLKCSSLLSFLLFPPPSSFFLPKGFLSGWERLLTLTHLSSVKLYTETPISHHFGVRCVNTKVKRCLSDVVGLRNVSRVFCFTTTAQEMHTHKKTSYDTSGCMHTWKGQTSGCYTGSPESEVEEETETPSCVQKLVPHQAAHEQRETREVEKQKPQTSRRGQKDTKRLK